MARRKGPSQPYSRTGREALADAVQMSRRARKHAASGDCYRALSAALAAEFHVGRYSVLDRRWPNTIDKAAERALGAVHRIGLAVRDKCGCER